MIPLSLAFENCLKYFIYVATLTLGSRPKQRFARLQAKREADSNTTYSWECEKV